MSTAIAQAHANDSCISWHVTTVVEVRRSAAYDVAAGHHVHVDLADRHGCMQDQRGGLSAYHSEALWLL